MSPCWHRTHFTLSNGIVLLFKHVYLWDTESVSFLRTMMAGVTLVFGGNRSDGGRGSSGCRFEPCSVSLCVILSLGKTLHPPCLLMMVRGPIVWQPHFCQCAPGQLWLQCSSPLSVCECVYELVDDRLWCKALWGTWT
ncbi:hypothetical protein GOODEAATRI_017930 [Goodea atripinnis]|uniref:Uncharacterized protein n=1 Tax=Goodea atripinnis TaxID=208336 RepID=A0ABV0MW06_9TELE